LVSLPNILTVSRVFMLPLIIVFLFIDGYRQIATALLALACATDFLDGYMARKMKQVSKFGTVLDPVADKIFGTTFLVLMPFLFSPEFPLWYSIVLILREGIMVTGWALHYYISGSDIAMVSKLGKANTVFQFTVLGLALIGFGLKEDFGIDFWLFQGWQRLILFSSVSLLTAYTTADYIERLVKKGFGEHPDVESPLTRGRKRRRLKRALKNKPPRQGRITTFIDRKKEEAGKKPLVRPEKLDSFPKIRICQICQGMMKGHEVAKCSCGRYFHSTCLKMTKVCPRCGAFIDIDANGG